MTFLPGGGTTVLLNYIEPQLAVSHLANNVQIQYQLTLWEKLRIFNHADWDATSTAIQEAAHETLGLRVIPKNNRQFVTDDPEIRKLSRKLKELNILVMTDLPRERACIYALSNIRF